MAHALKITVGRKIGSNRNAGLRKAFGLTFAPAAAKNAPRCLNAAHYNHEKKQAPRVRPDFVETQR
jgi:hypothetical protein